MILFVFEGKDDSYIFKTLENLFFKKKEKEIYCFNQNIYELYRLMQKSDFTEDIVSVIRDRKYSDDINPLQTIKDVSDISEVYLFFDYDFQNSNIPLEQINIQLKELLEFFNNENGNGKLYINYPMLESVRCTDKLPDKNFWKYTAKREECKNFKYWSTEKFPFYKSLDFITIPISKKNNKLRLEYVSKEHKSKIKNNWEYLKQQNISKANYICSGNNEIPNKKEDISQNKIFEKQLEKFVNTDECCVSILNAFPLFLYEYFK